MCRSCRCLLETMAVTAARLSLSHYSSVRVDEQDTRGAAHCGMHTSAITWLIIPNFAWRPSHQGAFAVTSVLTGLGALLGTTEERRKNSTGVGWVESGWPDKEVAYKAVPFLQEEEEVHALNTHAQDCPRPEWPATTAEPHVISKPGEARSLLQWQPAALLVWTHAPSSPSPPVDRPSHEIWVD
jgi:hypothetical protein